MVIVVASVEYAGLRLGMWVSGIVWGIWRVIVCMCGRAALGGAIKTTCPLYIVGCVCTINIGVVSAVV